MFQSKKFYAIQPEVAGNIAESEGDLTARPPLIRKLHYVFDGWLGDVLLEALCCFIVIT